MRVPLALALAISMVLGACSSSGSATTTTAAPPVPPTPGSSTTEPPTTAPPATTPPATSPATTDPATTTTVPEPAGSPYTAAPRLAAFAEYEAVPLLPESQVYRGPNHPDSLDGVLVAGALDWVVEDPAVSAALTSDGFAIQPGWATQFHHAYEWPGYENQVPVFVTTDAAFHAWHLVFSKALRATEQDVLLPKLDALVAGLLDGARDQQQALAGTPLADDADRVVEFYQAAGSLLGVPVGGLGTRAIAEVDLALEALQMTASPITTFDGGNVLVGADRLVDYTQFRPRGHYTTSAALARYFRAMAMLGQSAFFLSDPQSLRLGVLAVRPLVASSELSELWADIYEPTAFLVGTADDYTPFELSDVVAATVPGAVDDPLLLLDDAAIPAIRTALLATRGVAINPEAASVRVMGARFVLDSFILDQLAWPNVGEPPPELRRVRVSPLDVAAAFGSEYAYELQDQAGETGYRNYVSQMEAMRDVVAGRADSDWAGTVYDAWLYALEPLWLEHGAPFPDFMQSAAWSAKAHQTGFGSYTELKHDTVLYAKQGFAAEAGGDPPRFVPRHWVEPDPVPFLRLAAAARLTRDGLADRGLLTDETTLLLDDVEAMLARLGRIAGDELAGLPLSAEDNDWLAAIGPLLEWLWLASTEIDSGVEFPEQAAESAALIADIFRTSFDVLELGTGFIDTIYVLVPNDSGTFQLAVGGVYSYYEFWQPAGQGRLTDEEWRALLEAGEQPPRPAWLAPIYVAG